MKLVALVQEPKVGKPAEPPPLAPALQGAAPGFRENARPA